MNIVGKFFEIAKRHNGCLDIGLVINDSGRGDECRRSFFFAKEKGYFFVAWLW